MFSPVEQFQDSILRIFNPRIRKHFRDVITEDEDLSSDRAQLRRACLHEDKDSLVLTCGKLLLFILLKIEQVIDLQVAILGGGVDDGLKDQYQIKANNLPQISINFSQPNESVPKGTFPVPATISFRLTGYVKYKKSGQSGVVVTEAVLTSLSTRIKNEFKNLSYIKGDELYLYTAPLDGFFGSRCYANNQSEAEKVFRAMCQVAQKDFDPVLVTKSVKPAKSSDTRPSGSVSTYQGSKKDPRWRPRVRVQFTNAVADVGLLNPVVLVDASGMLANPLVKH